MKDRTLFDSVPFGVPEAWLQTEDKSRPEKGEPEGRRSVAEKLNAAERLEVNGRRAKTKAAAPKNMDAAGLALSGGGIRSATFCLGFVQVLADRGLLERIDFLSTVSGGGYTGSFITSRLETNEDLTQLANPHGPDTGAIAFVRQRAKYLAASNLAERWSMLTSTLAGLLLNWTAPLFFLSSLAIFAIFLTDWFNSLRNTTHYEPWAIASFAVLAISTSMIVLYAIRIRFRGDIGVLQRPLGAAFLLLAIVLGGWALYLGFGFFAESVNGALGSPFEALQSSTFGRWLGGTITLSSLLGAFPMLTRVLPLFEKPSQRELVLKISLYALGLLVPLSAVLVFYALCFIGVLGPDAFDSWPLFSKASHASTEFFRELHWFREEGDLRCGPSVLLLTLWISFGLVSLFLLNINLTSPHRLYRDQLAATFIAQKEGDAQTKLLEAVNAAGVAPYHLINATANLPSSETPALRDRKCDFFLFSKHWCGSVASGYRRTPQWNINQGAKIDLATAMAVSGAAVAPRMGLGSMPALSALLSLLNLRLSFWILNRSDADLWAIFDQVRVPGFTCLMREMFSFWMDEKARWLNLSDGGHIENLGVYELLRRRCKFIVCVDGEADLERSFHGLVTVIRHAQIDFGVQVLAQPEDLAKLRKNAEGLSAANAVLFRILYPKPGAPGQTETGLMLYAKLAVIGNEPVLVNQYRLGNPDFPHQPTLDQFFDQEQFEAYRQLGVHVAEGVCPAKGGTPVGVDPMAHWFERLARETLAPKELAPGAQPGMLAT